MRFKEKLARFMWGRYGIDGLYYGLFVSYLVMWAVQYVFYSFRIVKGIANLLGLAILVFMIFRVFSKNIPRRRRENEVFMRVWTKVKNFFVLQKNKIRDFKKFTYKKCPHCRITIRLPRKKGEHSVVCPKCRQRFSVKNWF